MKIAVSAENKGGLDATIAMHFGRCPFYVFVDVEGTEVKNTVTLENPFFENHGSPGQVPGFIKDNDANVMIAGGMGGRALEFFKQFGIEPVTGASGRVGDIVELYLKGGIKGTKPCAGHGHEHGGHSCG